MNQTVQEWYEESFGEDYLLIYRHRNREEAKHEVRKMIGWLELPQQSQILDLCCGMGRHALNLADAGYLVTGVDLSSVLLQVAKESDIDERVKWIQSDMRDLPQDFTERFDAVLNIFTSFGYFEEDSEQMKVLRQIRRALKPEGRFVIDVMNASYTVNNLVPHSKRIDQGVVIAENRQVENEFVTKRIVIQEQNRTPRSYIERVKLYTVEKLTVMLQEAGLVLDQVYGGYDGQLYDSRLSKRMIMVGHRGKL